MIPRRTFGAYLLSSIIIDRRGSEKPRMLGGRFDIASAWNLEDMACHLIFRGKGGSLQYF